MCVCVCVCISVCACVCVCVCVCVCMCVHRCVYMCVCVCVCVCVYVHDITWSSLMYFEANPSSLVTSSSSIMGGRGGSTEAACT